MTSALTHAAIFPCLSAANGLYAILEAAREVLHSWLKVSAQKQFAQRQAACAGAAILNKDADERKFGIKQWSASIWKRLRVSGASCSGK